MTEDVQLSDYQEAYNSLKKEEEKQGLLWHIAIYVVVNAVMVAVNLVYLPGSIWFIYPLLGWGLGLLSHYFFGFRNLEERLNDRAEKAEERAKEE